MMDIALEGMRMFTAIVATAIGSTILTALILRCLETIRDRTRTTQTATDAGDRYVEMTTSPFYDIRYEEPERTMAELIELLDAEDEAHRRIMADYYADPRELDDLLPTRPGLTIITGANP